MKRLLPVLFAIIVLSSCDETTENSATDARLIRYTTINCFCCAGWEIVIGSDTVAALTLTDEQPLIDSMNANGQSILVDIDYKFTTDECSFPYVEVTNWSFAD